MSLYVRGSRQNRGTHQIHNMQYAIQIKYTIHNTLYTSNTQYTICNAHQIHRIIIIITNTPPAAKAVYWVWNPKTAINSNATGDDHCRRRHHHHQITKLPCQINATGNHHCGDNRHQITNLPSYQIGLQTISELSTCLLRTKEVFTDSRTTRFPSSLPSSSSWLTVSVTIAIVVSTIIIFSLPPPPLEPWPDHEHHTTTTMTIPMTITSFTTTILHNYHH